MNFLGIRVDGLDVAGFLSAGKAGYAVLFLGWVLLLSRRGKIRLAWAPIFLALLPWFLSTYPLQRLYGLESGTDRQRNLWWCATAAAGNPPWESGVVGNNNLEPAWAFFVSAVSMFDPVRVMRVYPFLPALAIVLVGLSFFRAFRESPKGEAPGQEGEGTLIALFVIFFVLITPTGPLDYLSPYRGFWQRMFLLKPNHSLGLALLPLFATLVTSRTGVRRSVASALSLGALGWVFIVYWALTCWGLAFYAGALILKRKSSSGPELLRLSLILFVSLVLVGPYLYYLVRGFPVVSFPTGVYPDDPQRSVWGDSPPATHSLFFLATFDLAPNFLLACFGMWTCWSRARRFDLFWLGLTVGAYAAWIANAVLLSIGQARQSDEIYYLLVVMIAVQAGVGMERVVARMTRRRTTISASPGPWHLSRVTAIVILLWFPLTLPWWWDPMRMDTHFRLSLDPIPQRLSTLSEWIRGNSRGDDVFFAGTDVALWIPALTGRRVLRTGMPWLKTEAHRDEVRILSPQSPDDVGATLKRLGVRFIVLDYSLRAEHHLDVDPLEHNPRLERVFETDGIKVYRSLSD